MKFALIVFTIILTGVGAVIADPTKTEWSGQYALGYSAPQGPASDFISSGWMFQGGFTWRPTSGPFGLRGDLAGNKFNASTHALDGYLDGNIRVWSLTADAVYDFRTRGPVGYYVTGGVGMYRLYANLTVPTWYEGYWCDPWGWCYVGYYPGQRTIWDKAVYEFGYNLGAAVTYKLRSQGQFYVEVTYHWVQTAQSTEYMPIVIGWRW